MNYYEKHIEELRADYREDLTPRWNSGALPLGFWPLWFCLLPFVVVFSLMHKFGQKSARFTSRIGYYWRLPGAVLMVQSDKIFKRFGF